MALVLADRVKVRSQTAGTGTFTLAGTAQGYQGFDAVGNGNETYYGIVDAVGNWEIGRGTYTAIGNTLSRDSVISSSNNDALVNFPEGGKNVFATFPSSIATSLVVGAGLDLSAVDQNILPSVDSDGTTGYTLGSPSFKWKELFVSNGSIYIGDVKLSNVAGKLAVTKVVNPGQENEAEDPDDSDAASEIGGGTGDSLTSNNDINITVNSEDSSNYTWNFGQTGDLTAPGDIVVGGVDGGHVYIDSTEGANTSVRWINIPVGEDHSIIRAYTGNPTEETDLNRGRIQLAWQDNDRSGLRIISYDRSDEDNSITREWTFQGDGGLSFPDGSVQTTAYTGQTGSGVIYIMANIDGDIVTSTDGVTWGDPTPSGMAAISRVAVHNGVIVYISGGGEGGPGQPGLYYSTTIGAVTLCAGTDNIDNNDVFWNQVRYFDDAQQWVAVGYIDGSTNNFPIVAHSTDGISWTLVPADNTFVSGINTTDGDWELTDVAYMAETGDFVISSSLNGEGVYGGIFITNNATVPLDGTVHIAIDLNVDHTAPWSVTNLGGPPGYMILFGTNDEVWNGYGTDTEGYSEDTSFWDSAIIDQIGYLPQITEIAYDADGFIAVTTGGHVITGSVSFDGPSFIVSIPLPYTSTTFSITNANPAVISFTEGSESATNNEKIEITLADEYNGTYYVNTTTGVLYTDQEMTTALNASTFASFTTGTVTFSHGMYFDAAGTSPNYYYIGNDDEQIFRSSNGITWTLQADVDGNYFNDFAYGTFGAGSISTLTNGEYSVSLGNTGTVTLPAGGTITEGIVTSNPTIQLTPASPDVASQKLVIKGGTLYNSDANGISIGINNNTFAVSDTVEIYVYANDYADQTLYWWIVPEEGGIADPGSGSITLDGGSGTITFTVDSDDYEFRVRVSPEENNYDPDSIGVESVLINGDAPTFDSDHHLHLTTGDLTETSIFLGTDDHNVRTTTNGKIQITTPSETNNVWEFGTNGDITLPGGMTIGNSNGVPAIQVSVDNPINILSQGLGGASNLQWINDLQEPTATSAVVVNSPFAEVGDVQIVTGAFDLQNPTAAEHSWTFGADGDLTLPNNSGIKSTTNIDVIIATPDSSTFNWQFGADGVLTMPGATISQPATPAAGEYGLSDTVLDLTKQIQVLTSDGTNNGYSLADGTEGQIMYFVPDSTISSSAYILVANARIIGEGPTDTIDYSWTPFDGEASVPATIAMAIFADGAWCLRGGASD